MPFIKSLYKFLSPKHQSLFMEYKVAFQPRYGHGKPAHKKLGQIINDNRNIYAENLSLFLKHIAVFHSIKTAGKESEENLPTWNNGFLPGLDIVALYGMVCKYKPQTYLEIGSGNSTRVARKAISDNKLDTRIISIDPFPRASIDSISDVVIREPMENVSDFSMIENLKENDILFIDNSHRCFPNSDVTVCFLEVLPRLKTGVVVHIHDIYLPYDYPQFMCDRFYSEQYLLATLLLANSEKYQTIFPGYFISEDSELKKIIEPVWNHPNLSGVEKHGGSFWFRVT